MKLSDFDYHLPEELIATRPARPRTASRLLVSRPQGLEDAHVRDLARFLRAGDRLVVNDTRVIPARLSGIRHRETRDGSGRARVEVTLTQALPGGCWRIMARPLRKLRTGDRVIFGDRLGATVTARGAEDAALRFDLDGAALDRALAEVGRMPLPPYIESRRAPDERDREDYQTVFAERAGAVAAPTASLHFDSDLLERLQEVGVGLTRVTLHVGAGTFLPVKVENLDDHKMHAEWGEVGATAAQEIAQTRAAGGRVIAVGTTALRLIETAARGGGIAPWRGETDIFIRPGFRFHAADALMTNFHLPKSTLLMLVAAFVGMQRMRAIYAHAVARRYRFFSYGDSSLLFPGARSGPGSDPGSDPGPVASGAGGGEV